MLGRQFRLVHVEPETGAGRLETLADHPGVRTTARHALAERGVIVLAAAGLANQRENMALAVREIGLQPLAEEVAHLKRQPQQHVAGRLRPTGGGSFENALDLRVVDRRDDRRDHHGGRNAGRAERADRKSTRLNSSHSQISYAVFCLKKKKKKKIYIRIKKKKKKQ